MILDRYLSRQFFPIFIVAATMFVLLLTLIDLFANLVRYLNYEVPFIQIMRMSFFYLPKSFSYALPISLLFAAAYTLGDLYARNELTSVFSSGIPFWRFCMSLVFIGLLASAFAFFFDDMVVIPTLKIKNELSRQFLHQDNSENSSDVVIKAKHGHTIYSVDYYDNENQVINGVSIVEQDDKGDFVSLIRAPLADWTGEYWNLQNAVIYRWDNGLLRISPLPDTTEYRELPDTFRRSGVKVEELPAKEAGLLVEDLRSAGLPFIEAQAEYHHRFSFSTASFVVMILSISMGGRFRKNILLMSLFSSLAAAVVFYVMEMISMMLAKQGYIPPAIGAWFPVGTFIVLGFFMLRGAKT